MKSLTLEIYWDDLNEEAQRRLDVLWYPDINTSPLAIIDFAVEEEE